MESVVSWEKGARRYSRSGKVTSYGGFVWCLSEFTAACLNHTKGGFWSVDRRSNRRCPVCATYLDDHPQQFHGASDEWTTDDPDY